MNLNRQIIRYGLVGLANTAVGYGLILMGLRIGLGDYRANALGYGGGLCFSFFANRRFTFNHRGAVTALDVIRFLSCFAISYSANLGIITLGLSAGLAEHPLVHLAAMVVYSLIFFACMRSIVFKQKAA